MYEATQRYAEAAALFERSLTIRRAHQLDIVTPLTHLAYIAAAQDRYQEAEQDYRAVRTYLYTAYLPGAYYKLDRIDEAAATEKRTLALARKRFGPSHHRVATALNDLGVMESERHHLDKAEAYMQQALAMREKLLGPAHPDCAISLGGPAAVATEQGRPSRKRICCARWRSTKRPWGGPTPMWPATWCGSTASWPANRMRWCSTRGWPPTMAGTTRSIQADDGQTLLQLLPGAALTAPNF